MGEIYLVCEPHANFFMEERLSKMGVEVTRTIYLADWFDVHIIKELNPLARDKGYLDITKGYLGHMIGGHGLETVAHTLKAKEDNYDGVIQIYPFTCAPEIMAQGIIHKISGDKAIPVITFSIDEHSAEAGIQTRLEAFIDLLIQRKKEKEGKMVYG
ncbi:2-hydroxyglutaryl-CoA dehydratase, D-component [Anaerobranca californiensis DSM 14826]|uniref:2-hydroxyglutaryl-CoA dehydratase, D-component n=1 Tax=Anaerobranca californiensis DSM 14826 TaxID=1120989 RepID=A0A1M6L1X4_9FIRM|nr:2-hydroxyglutaryl-CoA dehydratase, D-component [Anaerobranca californiensis DSM 14826]